MQAAVVLLCGLLLSQAAATSTPTATGRIAGRIVADGANTPIAGAMVTLFPSLPPRPARPMAPGRMMWRPIQTQTDDDGRFVFEKVAAGAYRVDVQKTGFAGVGEPGRAPTTDVAAGKTTDVTVTLQKGGVIAGKVLDAQGEPLPDVRMMAMRRLDRQAMPPQAANAIFLAPAAASGQQQTNDLGEFRLANLAPGEYYVAAMPNGGMPFGGPGTTPTATGKASLTTYYPGTNDQAAASPIKVTAGDTVYNIVFGMQSAPGFRITGQVVDENGAAVSGAMVMLMPARPVGGFNPPNHATSGENGRFTFVDIPSASYRVNASIPIQLGNGRGSTVTSSGATATGSTVATSGGTFSSWTSVRSGRGPAGSTDPAVEATVSDADVSGIRVVVRRPQQ
jgi:protocatechuate 3,4-dioxygenase beta subunit